MQRAHAQFGVGLAVVFHLHPGHSRFVKLTQGQIGHRLKHGQQPAFDLAPEDLLFSVLVRGKRKRSFVDDAQARQTLLGFGREHRRAVIAHEGARQGPFLKALTQPVAKFFGPFAQIPLGVAAQTRVVVQATQQEWIGPLAVFQEDPQRAVMKVQVPESVDIFTLVAADLATLESVLSGARAGATGRTSPGTFEQALGFHETQHRSIRRLGVGLRCLLGQYEQVVGVELVTPVGMLAVLG